MWFFCQKLYSLFHVLNVDGKWFRAFFCTRYEITSEILVTFQCNQRNWLPKQILQIWQLWGSKMYIDSILNIIGSPVGILKFIRSLHAGESRTNFLPYWILNYQQDCEFFFSLDSLCSRLSLPWCSLLYCRAQMNFSSIACLVSRYCVFSSHFVMKFRCQFRLCNLVVIEENLRVSTIFICRLKFSLTQISEPELKVFYVNLASSIKSNRFYLLTYPMTTKNVLYV